MLRQAVRPAGLGPAAWTMVVFGVLALVWSAVLYVRAVYYRCYSEMVIAIAHCMSPARLFRPDVSLTPRPAPSPQSSGWSPTTCGCM